MIPSGGQRPLWNSDKRSPPQKELSERSKRYQFGIPHDVFKGLLFQKNQSPQATNGELVESSNLDPPEKESNQVVMIRRSAFFLLTTILGIEIICDLFLPVIRFLFMFLPPLPFFSATQTATFFITFFIVTLLKLNFMVFAILKWLTTHYVIGNGEIRYQTGLLNKKEKIFFCALAQEVVYTQTFMGRILNYGTIEIYNPAIKEKIYLDTIPDPKKYVEKVKENMPKGGSGGYIIERQ